MSQTAFAALAGAKKGAQLKWEKGESFPTADVLSAFSTAGVDVLYVLTGRREADDISISHGLDIREELNGLEYTASHLEEEALRLSVELSDLSDTVNHRLTEIALNVRTPADSRERADDILRLYFGDESASDRRSARFGAISAERRYFDGDLEDVLRGIALNIDRDSRNQILSIMIDYQIEAKAMLPLLDTLRRYLPPPNND